MKKPGGYFEDVQEVGELTRESLPPETVEVLDVFDQAGITARATVTEADADLLCMCPHGHGQHLCHPVLPMACPGFLKVPQGGMSAPPAEIEVCPAVRLVIY